MSNRPIGQHGNWVRVGDVLLNDRRLVSNPAGPVCTLAAPHDATAKEAVGIKHYPA